MPPLGSIFDDFSDLDLFFFRIIFSSGDFMVMGCVESDDVGGLNLTRLEEAVVVSD